MGRRIRMQKYYLAIDMGASSGRHMLGTIKDGKIVLEEVYRFENGMKKVNGHLCWDLEHLFKEIKTGLIKCKEIGKIPTSMSIDTWGVDYVLLDKEDRVIGNTYGYRDNRTKGMDQEVYQLIDQEALYEKTGIQKMIINTIYHLMAVKNQEPEHMEQATALLMVPDYFQFLLTGNKVSDYTNATTGQLVSPTTKEWDYELIERLGFKKEIFIPLSMPGTSVGRFTKAIQAEVGFDCQVILAATHDTASAVIAVPTLTPDCLYISSGTWSLMGIEHYEAICTKESMKHNFTNEGGYDYRFRFLKNIMGLWMIQSVRHELGDRYTFAEICDMAELEKEFPARVDVNDDCFLAPDNMTEEIKDFCRRTSQLVPDNLGQLATVIYQSLAESYAKTAKEIEMITGRSFAAINIVGGGSNASYLNQLTANKSGRTVYAGPAEATAIGNLAVQMIEEKEFDNLQEVRACIYESFGVKEFQPEKEKK